MTFEEWHQHMNAATDALIAEIMKSDDLMRLRAIETAFGSTAKSVEATVSAARDADWDEETFEKGKVVAKHLLMDVENACRERINQLKEEN